MKFTREIHGLVLTTDGERQLAGLVLQIAARDLRLDPLPTIDWFTQYSNAPKRCAFTQRCNPHEINIRQDLPPYLLAEAVLHEVRHLWQFRQPKFQKFSDDLHERDARLYVFQWGIFPERAGYQELTERFLRAAVAATNAAINRQYDRSARLEYR